MTLKSDKKKLLQLIHDAPEMRAKEGKCEKCGAQWWLVKDRQGIQNMCCPVCGERIEKE